jgi:hypothetical protein
LATNNFIPEIWCARLLGTLDKTHIYAARCNRDYEGEINALGDTVRINSIGDVSVSTYTKGTNHAAPEELDDAQQILQITEAKMFNFAVDDVDKAQANVGILDAGMERAGYALRDTVDTFLASLMTVATTANLIGSTNSPKADLGTLGQAYEYFVDLKTLLDEANVPSEGRWAIVPAWFEGLMLKDERFVSFGTSENRGTAANGVVARAAGFDIGMSNNVPNTAGTAYKIIAGHQMATSFAEQLRKMEAYRPELRFADAVKGLHLYGAKVVRPNALAVLTANRPA